MWKEVPPFSFSAGKRKIMNHFVVSRSVVPRFVTIMGFVV